MIIKQQVLYCYHSIETNTLVLEGGTVFNEIN